MENNVLLICVSPITAGNKMRKYNYDGEKEPVEGFMTNEAPAKSVVKKLNSDHNKRLHKIVMICSDKTLKTKIQDTARNDEDRKKIDEMRKIKLSCDKSVPEVTAVEYFKDVINQFACEISDIYKKEPIRFEIIPIPNYTVGEEVVKSAVKAADKITADPGSTNLYIDFNGGQRYIAFMLLSIANLMRIRNVNLKEIMVMNIDNRKDGVEKIQNMEEVFMCMDLIAGINEYINYGRVKMLKVYFRDSKNTKIQDILRSLEAFSNNMLLCRTEKVFEQRDKLRQELDEYLADAVKNDAHDILFAYVSKDIRNGCITLLNGQIPEVIQWCVEKDFIQQALTFYAERMPVNFQESGICEPTQKEKEEYNRYLKDCESRKASQEQYEIYKKNYKRYNKDYCWFVKYLLYNRKEDKSADNKSVPENEGEERVKCNNVEIYGFGNEQLHKAKESVNCILKGLNAGRAKTNIPKEELEQILLYYFLIKDQRNQTSHAGGNGEAGSELTYEVICKVLLDAVKQLQKYE